MATSLLVMGMALGSFVNVSIDNGRYTRTESYVGQQVVRCEVHNTTKPSDIAKIPQDYDVFGHVEGKVDVRVKSASERAQLESLVGGSCDTIVADLEKNMQDFEAEMKAIRAKGTADWFEEYHTLNEIMQWYESKADEFPRITKLVPSIGRSHEGRSIPAFHITGDRGGEKKVVYFQCQIHSREWISGATCGYIVDTLLNGYGVMPEITDILNEVELVVVPMVNPDGYLYTWSNTRLWRKNRSPAPRGSTCIGTDLNRNYRDHWGEGGSSTDPCKDTYMGTAANSEPETVATTQYFKNQNGPVYGAIDWHSYSQLILRPYGWTSTPAPDELLNKQIGDIMRDEAEKVYGKRYRSQPSIDLYPTTGTANDWFYGDDARTSDVRAYGYTIELRDTGSYGFILPPSEIIPQGQEMIQPTLEFLKFVVKNPLKY